MRHLSSLPAGGRYVLTPRGRDDLSSAETCTCTIRLVGLIFECRDCGTVYGSMRDQLNDRGRAFSDKPL